MLFASRQAAARDFWATKRYFTVRVRNELRAEQFQNIMLITTGSFIN